MAGIFRAGLVAASVLAMPVVLSAGADNLAHKTAAVIDFSKPEPFEALQGGAATSIEPLDKMSFSHSVANLGEDEFTRFMQGRALFRKIWVSSPSTTRSSDGLGPLYNARSCQACHVNDGRGLPPANGLAESTLILRLARKAENPAEERLIAEHKVPSFPDSLYGEQLQDKAVRGLAAEGQFRVSESQVPVRLADGAVIRLTKPVYRVDGLAHGAFDKSTTISARLPPQIIGMGLIEAIGAADILKNADPLDQDGDGISGRAQWVSGKDGATKLGRFGWKAQAADIRMQSAHAFANDMGISTSLFPKAGGDCTALQKDCLALPDGANAEGPEADDIVLDLVSFYVRTLAVPARRKSASAPVLEGKRLFHQSGCASCHVPQFVTSADAEPKYLASQSIWPYSDFLLHDMGDGLADGQQVGEASGREWRTPPLWGLGLTATVSGKAFYLHDGRAKTLEEAILWHNGEARAASEQFKTMSRSDREKLAAFLESL